MVATSLKARDKVVADLAALGLLEKFKAHELTPAVWLPQRLVVKLG